MKLTLRSKHVGWILIGLISVVTVIYSLSIAYAQREPSLTDLAIKADDLQRLPDVTGSAVIDFGTLGRKDLSHPLSKNQNPSMRSASEALFSFNEGYAITARVWGNDHGGFMANYLYRYANAAQAQAAMNELMNVFANAGLQRTGAKPLNINTPTKPKAMSEQAFAIKASDGGTTIYWFVGVKGRVLNLLIMDTSSSFEGPIYRPFEALVNIARQK
ncbi:MAG: hypothetical protein C4294_19620 [Nitrospiraceae bacterium]